MKRRCCLLPNSTTCCSGRVENLFKELIDWITYLTRTKQLLWSFVIGCHHFLSLVVVWLRKSSCTLTILRICFDHQTIFFFCCLYCETLAQTLPLKSIIQYFTKCQEFHMPFDLWVPFMELAPSCDRERRLSTKWSNRRYFLRNISPSSWHVPWRFREWLVSTIWKAFEDREQFR